MTKTLYSVKQTYSTKNFLLWCPRKLLFGTAPTKVTSNLNFLTMRSLNEITIPYWTLRPIWRVTVLTGRPQHKRYWLQTSPDRKLCSSLATRVHVFLRRTKLSRYKCSHWGCISTKWVKYSRRIAPTRTMTFKFASKATLKISQRYLLATKARVGSHRWIKSRVVPSSPNLFNKTLATSNQTIRPTLCTLKASSNHNMLPICLVNMRSMIYTRND